MRATFMSYAAWQTVCDEFNRKFKETAIVKPLPDGGGYLEIPRRQFSPRQDRWIGLFVMGAKCGYDQAVKDLHEFAKTGAIS